ncbi:MAG TPA: hypothetical protein VE954_29265 [Oligoflexus sp.]|uniref:hypothetical protein n=1 Tax=Oligoflexus sp. TaxID=1971216 RepID=UPI002D50A122|nr:hypothetical protein [Oligoflexus sp.]HYX37213.1 hypothetical protein [Oligoflexus sp.]
MLVKNVHLKLALVLSLSALSQTACNNTKAEQLEEEESSGETASDAAPTRDNRSVQSGDAAFIKIYPDGDIVPTRAETTAPATTVNASTPAASTPAASGSAPTASAPAAEAETNETTTTPAAPTPAPVEETTAAAPAPSTSTPAPAEETPAPATETQPATPAPVIVETPAPAPEPIVINEPAPAPAPIVVSEPTPAPVVVINEPAPAEETASPFKEMEDPARLTLAINEATASQLMTIQPKEFKATVAIGKHSGFTDGPYMIFAKWTDDSKKVNVKVSNSNSGSDEDCKIDESATQVEWKTLGVFYLTKNAKVVISNKKNSTFSVKNELLLKPVIAENLTKPSKFKCLDGQIDGQGLVGYQ